MPNFFPAPLKNGSRVALLAPAGAVAPEAVEKSVAALAKFGFEAVVCRSCYENIGYLAGSDELRAADINEMFADGNISGILAIRGGYGSQRLLPLLDYLAIARNPKVFAGYSDISALLNIVTARCGFVTFHSPMPASELIHGLDKISMDSYERMFKTQRGGIIGEVDYSGGGFEGELCGGNLSVMASSAGTDYELDTRGKVLFLEEIDEEPYRIDRYLLQMKLSGMLRRCAGVVFGRMSKDDISEIIYEYVLQENTPCATGLMCGHGLPSLTLPIGAEVAVGSGKIRILKL